MLGTTSRARGGGGGEPDTGRAGAHDGPQTLVGSPPLPSTSSSHGPMTAAHHPVLTESLLNLSRSCSSEVQGPRVSDTGTPLTSVGGGGGEGQPAVPALPRACLSVSVTRGHLDTGEPGGGGLRVLALTSHLAELPGASPHPLPQGR